MDCPVSGTTVSNDSCRHSKPINEHDVCKIGKSNFEKYLYSELEYILHYFSAEEIT
jgi:hypothetical protein